MTKGQSQQVIGTQARIWHSSLSRNAAKQTTARSQSSVHNSSADGTDMVRAYYGRIDENLCDSALANVQAPSSKIADATEISPDLHIIRLLDLRTSSFWLYDTRLNSERYLAATHVWDGSCTHAECWSKNKMCSELKSRLAACIVAAKQESCDHIWLDAICVWQWRQSEITNATMSMRYVYEAADTTAVLLLRNEHVSGDRRWLNRKWTMQEMYLSNRLLPVVSSSISAVPRCSTRTQFQLHANGSYETISLREGRPMAADALVECATRMGGWPGDEYYALAGLLRISLVPDYSKTDEQKFDDFVVANLQVGDTSLLAFHIGAPPGRCIRPTRDSLASGSIDAKLHYVEGTTDEGVQISVYKSLELLGKDNLGCEVMRYILRNGSTLFGDEQWVEEILRGSDGSEKFSCYCCQDASCWRTYKTRSQSKDDMKYIVYGTTKGNFIAVRVSDELKSTQGILVGEETSTGMRKVTTLEQRTASGLWRATSDSIAKVIAVSVTELDKSLVEVVG